MKLLEYIRSLNIFMKKPNILDDIKVTRDVITQSLQPIVSDSRLPSNMSSPGYNAIHKSLGSLVGRETVLDYFQVSSVLLLNNLLVVEDGLIKKLPASATVEGLTADIAVMVKAAEQIGFAASFMMDIVEFIFISEAVNSKTETSLEDIEDWRYKRIMVTMPNFIAVMKNYAVDTAVFRKKLAKVPDVILVEGSPISSVVSDIDPFSTGVLSNFRGNPIYHMGKMFAERQAERYKLAQEKKSSLELRLLHLKMLNEGNTSPSLEKEIKYITTRIEGLEYKIAKAETSVGGVD